MAEKKSTPALCRGRGEQPGCGAQLRWPKNPKTGRGIPVDYHPVPDGNIAIEGGIAVHLSAKAAAEYQGDKFISHFATCPNAGQFRTRKPNRSASLPEDLPRGTFESPAAAAVGRIEVGATDIRICRLTDEFVEHQERNLGKRPDQAALQALWTEWQRDKRNMGVDPSELAIVAKLAKARIPTAEVSAA